MDHRLPSFLLATILAVLLASLFLGGNSRTPQPLGTGTSLDTEGPRILTASIDRLARRVDALEAARSLPVAIPSGAPAAAAADSPAPRREAEHDGGEIAVLRAEVARLWQAVASKSSDRSLAAAVDYSAMRHMRTDYDAIKVFCELRESDSERAREEVWLMSQDEVLRRFGRPHSIEAQDSQQRSWYFHTQDEKDGFSLTFVDGHVIDT